MDNLLTRMTTTLSVLGWATLTLITIATGVTTTFPKSPKHNGTLSNKGLMPGSESPLKVLDTLLRGYDRRSTPTNGLGYATNVITQLYIASLGSINSENMDYTTDTYLRQKWTDPRLASEKLREPLDLADPKLVQAIWKPEVFFPNAKEGDFQFVTMPNLLIRIHPDGEILYILRLRLKFSCMMELSRYPLDRQVCGMQISSFSKTTRELQLEWTKDEEAVSVSRDLRMPQFELELVTAKACDNKIHMGNYSCLVAQFHLKRSISFHLIQNYLPSILIVAVSWVSFWMDIESVPGRISLGVITLLAVSNQASGTNVPQTSYVKAIDIWMGTCTAFVFAALVEFTFVNYTWRTKGKIHGIPTGLEASNENLLHSNGHSVQENHTEKNMLNLEMGSPTNSRTSRMLQRSQKWRRMALSVDEVSRILFPMGFTVFNISYWVYYLHVITKHPNAHHTDVSADVMVGV